MKPASPPINYKSKYYRVLATLWIVMIIGGLFLWNIHGTLDEIYEEIAIMDKNCTREIIQSYHENGWCPYDGTNTGIIE